jgi:hypothetical protein
MKEFMRQYFQRLADTENAKRVAAYNNAVGGWRYTSRVDAANNVPPRPFPDVPRKQVVVDVSDDEVGIIESVELACESQVKWGPGNTIVF